MTVYYPDVGGVRIADDQRSDLSLSDDTMPTGQLFDNSYIVALRIYRDKEPVAVEYKMRWKISSEGTYNDLSATGDINWVADTVLTNGSYVTEAESICSSQGEIYDDTKGFEREGANNQTVDLDDDTETEMQWAFKVDTAETYDFEIFDVTRDITAKSFTITFTTPSVYIPQIIVTLL